MDYWSWGLMLKIWKPSFNPYMESFSKRFVWMLLPKFPVELWVTQIFVDLENIVGRFVYFDEKTLCWNNKRIAWVLVEFDSEKGFLEDIEVSTGDSFFIQVLDYGREPFRCHHCYQAGHIKEKFPLLIKT
jgi:hypothetical protein